MIIKHAEEEQVVILNLNKYKPGIYRIINLITNKYYIGSASHPTKRQGNHFEQLRTNKHFNKRLQNAFNKHGEENFIWELLENCEKEELLIREQYYLNTLLFAQEFINKQNKKFYELGYNINPIAGSPKGLKRSEETKAKIRANRLKQGKLPLRGFTDEARQMYKNMFIKLHNEKRILPRRFTEEQRKEKSLWMKDQYLKGLRQNPLTPENIRKGVLLRIKPVLQFDKEGNFINEYESACEAARKLNFNNKNISACCKGNKKTYMGFVWKFK